MKINKNKIFLLPIITLPFLFSAFYLTSCSSKKDPITNNSNLISKADVTNINNKIHDIYISGNYIDIDLSVNDSKQRYFLNSSYSDGYFEIPKNEYFEFNAKKNEILINKDIRPGYHTIFDCKFCLNKKYEWNKISNINKINWVHSFEININVTRSEPEPTPQPEPQPIPEPIPTPTPTPTPKPSEKKIVSKKVFEPINIYCEVFKNNLHFQDFNVFLKENQWLSKCNCDINNWCLSVYPWINCGTFFKCFPCSPLIISFNKPVSVNLNVLNEKNVHEQLCIKTSLF